MGTRKRPYAFTEQGVAMLSSVLRSKIAIEVNIRIMRAFVSMRHFMVNHATIFQRLETIEFNQLESNKVQAKILSHQEEQDKRRANVSAAIYTQQINRLFQLDIDRHNNQYPPIEVSIFRHSHDRFLCIDEAVYHVGASIKDLGKKWFAFSKMEDFVPDELIRRINGEE